MKEPIIRRKALKLIATATVVGAASPGEAANVAIASARASDAKTANAWSRTHDRVWLGGDTWAARMTMRSHKFRGRGKMEQGLLTLGVSCQLHRIHWKGNRGAL